MPSIPYLLPAGRPPINLVTQPNTIATPTPTHARRLLKNIYERHAPVLLTMARGAYELRQRYPQGSSEFYDLEGWSSSCGLSWWWMEDKTSTRRDTEKSNSQIRSLCKNGFVICLPGVVCCLCLSLRAAVLDGWSCVWCLVWRDDEGAGLLRVLRLRPLRLAPPPYPQNRPPPLVPPVINQCTTSSTPST